MESHKTTPKLTIGEDGIKAQVDWDVAKRIWRWLRLVLAAAFVGGGGFHVYDTRVELADIKSRLTRCEESELEYKKYIRQLTRALYPNDNPMPGNNPGSIPNGPPVTERK